MHRTGSALSSTFWTDVTRSCRNDLFHIAHDRSGSGRVHDRCPSCAASHSYRHHTEHSFIAAQVSSRVAGSTAGLALKLSRDLPLELRRTKCRFSARQALIAPVVPDLVGRDSAREVIAPPRRVSAPPDRIALVPDDNQGLAACCE
jgi:hypothetical protein